MGLGLDSAKVHLYGDDTILYAIASSVQEAMDTLQTVFNSLQMSLLKLKLVLNANKTKYTHTHTHSDHTILALDGTHIERVTSYKYLGIWLDDKLSFGVHIDN